MAEAYPSSLPGVLVAANSYTTQSLVERNDLSSGPPIFRARSDDGWMEFNCGLSLNVNELQVFRSWFRNNLRNGSKLFTIELWIDGFDGTKNTVPHECYFLGPPNYQQNGKRWRVTFALLAIEEITLEECNGDSLNAILCGFENPNEAIEQMNEVQEVLEDRWAV